MNWLTTLQAEQMAAHVASHDVDATLAAYDRQLAAIDAEIARVESAHGPAVEPRRGVITLCGVRYSYSSTPFGWLLTHGNTVLSVSNNGIVRHVTGPKPRDWRAVQWLSIGVMHGQLEVVTR